MIQYQAKRYPRIFKNPGCYPSSKGTNNRYFLSVTLTLPKMPKLIKI